MHYAAGRFDEWMWGALRRARARQRRKSILIIDDDHAQLGFVKRVLSPIPARLITSQSIRRTQELIYRLRPNLIVTDLNLSAPESGFSLIARVHQESGFRSLPIIVYSSREDPESRDRVRTLGAVDYISKASPPEALLRSVAFHLNR